jgi:hypothetical protein
MPQPARVAHQHRLDIGLVERPPQRLTGCAVVAGQFLLGGQQPGQQRPGQLLAGGLRQVGHVGRVVGQPGEILPGQLVGPERPLPQAGHGLAAFGQRQVGQVPGRLGAARAAVLADCESQRQC